MKAGTHQIPCRLEITVAEIRTVVSTPWFKTSAFKAWWKSTTASLTIPATGGMTWKAWAISVGVALAAASYEMFFGTESFRDAATPPAEPTAPTL